MGIGTSLGAYYDDSFHQAAAQWDPKYDNNELSPDSLTDNKEYAPLTQKVNDTGGGKYIGDLGTQDDISSDESVPIGRRNGETIDRHTDPEEFMKGRPADQEGFTLPGNPYLWIRKKRDEPLTS